MNGLELRNILWDMTDEELQRPVIVMDSRSGVHDELSSCYLTDAGQSAAGPYPEAIELVIG